MNVTLAQTGIGAWVAFVAVALLLVALLLRRRMRGGPGPDV